MHFDFSRSAATSYSPESVLIIVCSTLALYNAFELLALIITTVKRRKGLYFWSIFLASLGVIPYTVGWILVYFKPTIAYVGMIIDSIGWVMLVSGQSVVLYSRLHLVLNSAKILRAVLWMIICNGILWHTSITILLFGSTYSPSQSRSGFNGVYNVMEKVQLSFFCLQEFIISGLYIWAAVDILRTAFGNKRRFTWQLFSINVLIIAMDIAILVVEYMSYFVWEQELKVVIYSIKLKLEFAILSELVKFVQHHGDANSISTLPRHISGAVEPSAARQRTKHGRARSPSFPETMHVEESLFNAAVSLRPETSNYQESENSQIRVRTTADIEDCSIDLGDRRTMRHLYDDAVRQISRS
ncbi:hypothetical protein BGW36DRAFT_288726 [Talaromyces proteolyticus]|uniref:DUF7703 domain-containing protein n=1 Tax=Talaromyces proteolyticus TaxID=1131652 RepID=A0AAD4Q2Q9_9EURO|nr:uncharacterized protein BGW36DRAFT_288726 [Talaromyces proteolyticus]KAH8703937.1 hypothetical protein BGW36DRAFT_288726 [Talaromyces proteolyticus]